MPASDFALALKIGQSFGIETDMKTARKLGVTDTEVARLCSAVLDALAKGPLDPEQIRDAAGSTTRSLGEEGKKKGLNSTLRLALGKLQSDGEIRRLPVNGRLDQQRYRYALWRPNPLARHGLSMEESYSELARRYFSWIGPASLAEFQWFSGLGAKACRAAVEPLGLVAPENGTELLMLPGDLQELRGFGVPKKPNYVLVSSLDGISLLRRDLKGLISEADLKRSVVAEKGFRELGGLSDLPNHAIFDRGRLVGLWEFDPESGAIVWMSFGIKDKGLAEAVSRTEAFIRSDLGDARSFSLDSPKSRAPRIEALRNS